MASTEAVPFVRSGADVAAASLHPLPEHLRSGGGEYSTSTTAATWDPWLTDPLSMPSCAAPSYTSGFPVSGWDNRGQSSVESFGPLPSSAWTPGPSHSLEGRTVLPWCYDGTLSTAADRSPSFAGSEQITADALGCDITLWDTFDLQTVFNGDGLTGAGFMSSQPSFSSVDPPEESALPDSCVQPPASPAEHGCDVNPVDTNAFDVGLHGTAAQGPGRGTKRKRAPTDDDGGGRRKRRLQGSSAFVGFPVTDPDHIPPHDRKRTYLESLEEYTVWLEDQIRTAGLVPVSMERISTFQELKARTVRTIIFHQEEVLRQLHSRRQELQHKCRDLLCTAEAALVRGLGT
ncbi:hypothetical protein C8Q76DRAFT_694135 [Earliella scabrosa]|nr:hypothetical protein C8Q76DRAFT_694135 [Earliella scabrosa]